MIKLIDLQFQLIPAEPDTAASLTAYNEAYRCWSSVWEGTFKELDGQTQLYSDDFSRQSLVGGLFAGTRCVALGLFRDVDFDSAPARDDSYFKVWSESAVQGLLRHGPRVTVGSHITVDPEFRGEMNGRVRLKHLISGLMVREFLESGRNAMTGTMRCDRGMQKEAGHFGGTCLQSGVRHHGVEVELVAFYREALREPGALITDLGVEKLWLMRRDFREEMGMELRRRAA